MKKIAVSACLLGETCRYDGSHNRNDALLEKLGGVQVVPFCPEDDAFGTPRPTMDLIETENGVRALSNATGEDLTEPVIAYAKAFFESHPDIALFVGKDRSPSCGVCSARCYSEERELLSDKVPGLMAQEALNCGIEAIDAETFLQSQKGEKS